MIRSRFGLLIVLTLIGYENVNGFSSTPLGSSFITTTVHHFQLFLSTDGNDADILKEKASKLRQEAEEIKRMMERKRATTADGADILSFDKSSEGKKVYTELGASSWIMTYRFASDSYPKDAAKKIKFYSGQIKLQFTSDGYTNIIEDLSSTGSIEMDRLQFKKFWGWDQEVSSEDNLNYILFSADVQIPKSDPNYISKPLRFYFQARIDKDEKSGVIRLNDSTVTLKKDIEPPAGFWGVFSGRGILAQFRYCGEFRMKPC